ncbi:MAG: FlgD immunoglobulin-like domain containing protein, partial [Candidatus Marinimicrobia bacterium]|nr:FlgD immunoglobulin-like domain containing protein [Candidatus Neomarinimicrobiota bacterium]
TLTGIDGFSYWTAAPTGSDASLPVELSSWTAVSKAGQVLLTWTTDSEIENLGFIIEQKNARGNWNEIASFSNNKSLHGQGSTTLATEYQYTDKDVQVGQSYTYRLSDVDYHGKVTKHAKLSVTVKAKDESILIDQFTLAPAFPNPFNPSTTIRYGLPESSDVTLRIYDVTGREVLTMTNTHQSAGWYTQQWNGIDNSGNKVSTGMYFAHLQAGGNSQVIKLVYLQ